VAKAGSVRVSKRTRTEVERPIRYRRYEYLFLIVCEDEKTEPYYFRQFEELIPDETLYLRRVGAGLDPLGVIERAHTEREQLAAEFKREVDETWVVFDKDDADKGPGKTRRFLEALRIAASNTFHLAFSNEVFELWLLLHLAEVAPTAPIPRADIYAQLEHTLRQHAAYSAFQYAHGRIDVVDAVRHVGDEAAASQRAEALAVHHQATPPLQANPSTQVHKLVKRLRELIAYYGYEK
jgi:hypothetical protein